MAANDPLPTMNEQVKRLEAARTAYRQLSEDEKRRIIRRCYEVDRSDTFDQIFDFVTRRVGGPSIERVLQRAAPYGTLIDSLLLRDESLFGRVLWAYFGTDRYIPNAKFMGAMEQQGLTQAASDPARVEEVLAELERKHGGREFTLYRAALMYMTRGWFEKPGSGDKAPEVSPIVAEAAVTSETIDPAPSSEEATPTPTPPSQLGEALGANDLAYFELAKERLIAVDLIWQEQAVAERSTSSGARRLAGAIESASSALADIQRLSCHSHPCSAPPEVKRACERLRIPEGEQTVATLLGAKGPVVEMADALRAGRETVLRNIREMNALATDLGSPEVPEPPLGGACREIFEQLYTSSESLSEVRVESRRRLAAISSELKERVYRIREEYSLGPEAEVTLTAALERLVAPASLGEAREVERNIDQVRAALATEPSSQNRERLVRLARDVPPNLDARVRLLEVLGGDGDYELAVLFAWVLQMRLLLLDLPSGRVSPALTTLTQALFAVEPLMDRREWSRLVARQPWYSQVDSSGELAEETLLATGILLLSAAQVDQSARTIAAALSLQDAFGAAYPALARLATLTLQGVKGRVAVEDPSETLERARREVEVALQDPFSKVRADARHLGKDMGDTLLPRIKALWANLLSGGGSGMADPIAFRRELDTMADTGRALAKQHPHFSRLAGEAVAEVGDAMERYMSAASSNRMSGAVPVLATNLRADLERMATLHPSISECTETAKRVFASEPTTGSEASSDPVVSLCLVSPQIALAAPYLIAQLCDDRNASPDEAALDEVLSFIAAPKSPEDVRPVLERGFCLEQLERMLRRYGLDGDAAQVAEKRRSLERDTEQRVALLEPQEAATVSEIRSDLATGRLGAARDRLAKEEERLSHAQRTRAMQLDDSLKTFRSELRELVDLIDEGNMAEGWKHHTRTVKDTIESRIGTALSKQQTVEQKESAIAALERIMPRLRLHVEHQIQDFSPLEEALTQPAAAGPAQEAIRADEPLDIERYLPGISPEDLAARVSLWKAIGELSRPEEGKASQRGEAARNVMRGVAKLARLYSNEADPEKRFEFTNVRGVKFPLASTAFHKPGSGFFDQAVRVAVLASPRPAADEVDALRLEAQRTPGIYAVVVPGDAAPVRRQLSAEIADGRVTVLDVATLSRMLRSEKGWAPFRHAICRSVSVEITSPFRSEGHVVDGQNLFVGRDAFVNRLTNNRCWVVWGGRRSGKTSLLHAVRLNFSRKRQKHNAVYRSFEGLRADGVADVELQAARLVAAALRWKEEPKSLGAFAARLGESCQKETVCLLLDELDVYVGLTRNFEFMRTLRGVRNQVGEKLVVVCAGFKSLFRAVEMAPSVDDSSYPWKNFVEKCPVTKLDSNATASLVREGFTDILGIEVEATVPSLIFDRTGGHPAFVQKYCECVLQRLSTASRVQETIVTEREVDSVYQDESTGSFVHFYADTLQMNLDALERIVLIIMAAELLTADAPERFVPRTEIEQSTRQWFGYASKEPPSAERLRQALLFLEMTGMLDKRAHDSGGASYRMAFRSYVNILKRLERSNKDSIASLIAEFEG